MKDKLSREKLLEKLKSWRPRTLGVNWQIGAEDDEQAYSQLKAMLQPVSEERLKEFVENWNQLIAERVNVYNIEHLGEASNIGLVYPGTENLKQMLKEYHAMIVGENKAKGGGVR